MPSATAEKPVPLARGTFYVRNKRRDYEYTSIRGHPQVSWRLTLENFPHMVRMHLPAHAKPGGAIRGHIQRSRSEGVRDVLVPDNGHDYRVVRKRDLGTWKDGKMRTWLVDLEDAGTVRIYRPADDEIGDVVHGVIGRDRAGRRMLKAGRP